MGVVWSQLVSRGWSLGDAASSPLPHGNSGAAGARHHVGRHAGKRDGDAVPVGQERMTEEERARKRKDEDAERVRVLEEHLQTLHMHAPPSDFPSAPSRSRTPGAESVTEEELGS